MRSIVTVIMLALLTAGCGRRNTAGTAAAATAAPVRYTYRVKAVYPHAADSYTQGLQYIDGMLWEGTGINGESRLLRTDLESGRTEVLAELPRALFGEGITVLGEQVFQLTWMNNRAYVYDRRTMRKTGERRYAGEGWGLTTDGEKLYMSNGTSRIYRLNPDTFDRERTIDVTLDGNAVQYLNELEWIDGRIWANVYMSDAILIIDPATGRVEGLADLTGLLPEEERTPQTDVLNGIAFDPEGRRIFVTGKNWSKLFEIELIAE